MRRRNALRLAIAGVIPLVVLTGCGSGKSSSSKSSSTSASSSSAAATPVTVPANKVTPMSDISVDTKNAKAPTITLAKKPFQVNTTTTKVLSAGTGATVTASDTVWVNYVVVNGANGKQLVNTFSSNQVQVALKDPNQFPGLVTALKGAKIGTTEVVAIPPKDGFGGTGSSQLGVTNADTLVFYIKVEGVLPLEASGTTEQPQSGFPTVTVPKDNAKAATVTVAKDAKAPTKTESETLIQGTGAAVKEGQSVTVQYTGALWSGGKVFDSSASRGYPTTFTLSTSQMIKGFITGLTGKKVGSRVVIVIPPADGYGSQAQTDPTTGVTTIPANSTLVFVVDILAAQ